METSAPNRSAAGRWLLLVLSVGVGVVFWDSKVLYPLKLLVVMMHESGHALATLLLGGKVERVTLALDQSGACLSAYPPGFFGAAFVYSAGYLGSLIAGMMLILLSVRFNLARAVTWTLAGWLALMGVLYAGSPFTLVFCFGTAAVLALCAKLAPSRALAFGNLFIAAFSALYAVFDIRDDLWDSRVRGQSDAGLLAQLTHVPAPVWAGLWTVTALVLLAFFLRLSLRGKQPASPRRPAQLAISGRAKSINARQ